MTGRPIESDQPPKKRRTLIFNTDDEVTIIPATSKTTIVGTRADEEHTLTIQRLTGEESSGEKVHEDDPEILEAVVTGSKSADEHPDDSSNALSKEEALALLQSLRIVRVSPKKPDAGTNWTTATVEEHELLSDDNPIASGSAESSVETSKIEILEEPREEGGFVVRDGKILNVCHICSYESTVTSNFKRHLLVKHGLVENVKLFPKRKKPRFRKEKGDDDGEEGEGSDGRKKSGRKPKPKKPAEKPPKKPEIVFDAERPAVFRVKRTLKPFKKFEL